MIKHTLYIACLCLAAIAMPGCKKVNDLEKWKVNMERDAKKPYGTYLAFKSLSTFFPGAEVRDLSRNYKFSNINAGLASNSSGSTLLILTGINLHLSESEWDQLQIFVRDGNELVIFGSNFDQKIEKAFSVTKGSGQETNLVFNGKDLEKNRNILSLANDPLKRYGYTGRAIDGFFTSNEGKYYPEEITQSDDNNDQPAYIDTTATTTDTVKFHDESGNVVAPVTDTISAIADSETNNSNTGNSDYDDYSSDRYTIYDTLSYANGKPDCLRIRMGRGHITLHAAPLVTTNYFLLQDGNINYLAGLWSSFPADINRVYWDDYFTHYGKDTNTNALWRYDATRNGLLLAFFVAGVYLLFQLRRRQRIVPIIAPLRNDTVSFVETVGRLYYNKGNNANLAEKIIQQFLEWVRMNCYINTNVLNEEFEQQLAMKSGQPQEKVTRLVKMIHDIRTSQASIIDVRLYRLYRTIQQFYKNHRK